MNRATVLYVVRHTLGAPLSRLHGLDQLRALAAGGRGFLVVSFEPREREHWEDRQYESERRALLESGIRHVPLRMLSSRGVEVLIGAFTVLRLALFRRVRIVHARSYVPAVMGALARTVAPLRLVFDMRGLFVDEYVLEGALKPGSMKLAFARAVERWLLRVSDVVVVVSERFREHLLERPDLSEWLDPSKIRLIPNRVDLVRFEQAVRSRDETRRSLGYEESLVGVFAGSAAAWHLFDETARLMKLLMEARPDVRFLAAVYPTTRDAERIVRAAGLPADRTELVTADVDEIPQLFAASDFGLMLIDDDVSKRVCAPVKLAEYLASGLPVVAGGGIGDACDWVEKHALGVMVDPGDVAEASRRVLDYLSSEAFVTGLARERAKSFAAARMNMVETVKEYEDIYRSLDPR